MPQPDLLRQRAAAEKAAAEQRAELPPVQILIHEIDAVQLPERSIDLRRVKLIIEVPLAGRQLRLVAGTDEMPERFRPRFRRFAVKKPPAKQLCLVSVQHIRIVLQP